MRSHLRGALDHAAPCAWDEHKELRDREDMLASAARRVSRDYPARADQKAFMVYWAPLGLRGRPGQQVRQAS